MNISQIARVRYRIQFETRWLAYSSLFAGLAVFLLCVFFFGIKNYSELSGSYVFFSLWMPLIIFVAYGVLVRGLRIWNAVPYGVAGTLFCIFMIIRVCSDGSQNAVLAVIWFILTALVLLAVTLGLFAGKGLVVLMFLLPAVFMLTGIGWKDITLGDFWELFPELAAICGLLSFSLFGLCLKNMKIGRITNNSVQEVDYGRGS